MNTSDVISDRVLSKIYSGEREIHHRDISQDWFVGLLTHLQRSDSRPFKAYLRGVLAQHARWITREFDSGDDALDAVLAGKFEELRADGYSCFNLPREQVDEILAAFQGIELSDATGSECIKFGPDFSKATKTALSSEFVDVGACVLTMPAVVRLAANKQILKLARHYLGALPRLSGMGLSVYQAGKQGPVPSNDWHIDKGPVSWIKMFVYLNDVTPRSGPHAFVAGSHDDEKVRLALTKRLPDSPDMVELFLNKQRWSNAEVEAVFPGQEVRNAGPAGLMVLEDTRGFHKATPLLEGHRVMLTFEWSLDPCTLARSPHQISYEAVPDEIRPKSERAEQRFRYIFGEYLR